MKFSFLHLSTAFVLLLSILVACTYGQANRGGLLYERYFDAESPVGYRMSRAAATAPTTGDAAILEQGKRYHQAGDYDLALVSMRAYLQDNAEPQDFLPELLAGTSAMASGNYAEAKQYLQALPHEDSDADAAGLWYLSLLDLREENIAAAQGKLQLLSQSPAAALYPVDELLGRILTK